MKIYEMVFHKGTYEQTNMFYTVNSQDSRKHFVEQIRLELDTEFNDFKRNCSSSDKAALLSLFKAIHQESLLHVNTMAEDFIQNSEAVFDRYICLDVKEHDIINFK